MARTGRPSSPAERIPPKQVITGLGSDTVIVDLEETLAFMGSAATLPNDP